MSVRFFWSICGVVAIAALVLFITGNFTIFVGVVFGFIAFGLTFMGMMNVLPAMVSHPSEPKVKTPAPAVELRPAARTAPVGDVLKTWKSA